jgi:hypothetical protein
MTTCTGAQLLHVSCGNAYVVHVLQLNARGVGACMRTDNFGGRNTFRVMVLGGHCVRISYVYRVRAPESSRLLTGGLRANVNNCANLCVAHPGACACSDGSLSVLADYATICTYASRAAPLGV